MSLRQYLTIMLMSAVLCWVAFAMVIINIDPFQDVGVGFAFFYASLFFSLLGTFSLFSFWARCFSQRSRSIFHLVRASFRDSFIISAGVLIFLFLASRGFLNWMTGGILFAIMIVFSIYMYLLNRSTN